VFLTFDQLEVLPVFLARLDHLKQFWEKILSLPAMSGKPERIFSNCYTIEMTRASIWVLPQPLQLVISFIFTLMITKITDERELSMSSFNRVSNLCVCDPTPTVVSPSLRGGKYIVEVFFLRHTDGGDGGGGPEAKAPVARMI